MGVNYNNYLNYNGKRRITNNISEEGEENKNRMIVKLWQRITEKHQLIVEQAINSV